MPRLFIHVRNSAYRSRDEGGEYVTAEAALAAGVRSATTIAADEIGRGQRSTAIEVNIEEADGTCLLTSVVAISVSPLMVAAQRSDEPLPANDDASA